MLAVWLVFTMEVGVAVGVSVTVGIAALSPVTVKVVVMGGFGIAGVKIGCSSAC